LATRAAQGGARRIEPGADARVSELVARHERSLMRVARHWSLCRDDALDAYQRALEIYVRRLDSLDPATEIAWLKVVIKHEALAVRRQRGESVAVEYIDLDSRAAEEQRPVDDLLAARERVGRSAEALRLLKPDEAKALMLKAQGLSYQEIGETLSWSYTKVNRCVTEGRAHFLKVYAEIEAGTECERFAPTLAALVGGTASADALLELRPHIRNCATCRATVRDLHTTRLGRLGALWPVPVLLAPLRWASTRFGDRKRDAAHEGGGLKDALPPQDTSDLHGLVGRSPDPDLIIARSPDLHEAVARSQTPPTAGANARPRLVDWALQRAGEGVTSAKQHAASAYARAADPTPLAGVRPGAAVAAVAGCLAIGGGTTLCVTQGVDPIGGLAHVVSPAGKRKQDEPRKTRAPRRQASVTPTPTPAPPIVVATVQPAAPTPQPTAEASPQPTPTPTPTPRPAPEDEFQPVAPATAASTAPSSQPAPARTPAPAPAGGPGEFDGP
jgi:RNA polymerase sigma factor (sigma-70 family)